MAERWKPTKTSGTSASSGDESAENIRRTAEPAREAQDADAADAAENKRTHRVTESVVEVGQGGGGFATGGPDNVPDGSRTARDEKLPGRDFPREKRTTTSYVEVAQGPGLAGGGPDNIDMEGRRAKLRFRYKSGPARSAADDRGENINAGARRPERPTAA